MLFNSFAFLIFLPVVFILYWFVVGRNLRSQNVLILLASYFFYGWWSWKFMLLLALSTLLDYSYGFGVASTNKKRSKLFLWLGIVNNLGILGIFKYYNFFATQFQQGFALLGLHFDAPLMNIALPVGISFYTFHGMSYVFDIYRGLRKPVTNFVEYAVFVSFFPLLVAGPIERANHLLPQVQKSRVFSYSQAVAGCRLILWGMFKKVVIADGLTGIVDQVFNHYQEQSAFGLILGAIGFSFQIYGDFSGYTDIALGTAKLFGFELLTNFKFPYFSRDISEFWRRWHISLSSWFRDYLYIPLGGSKKGKLIAVRNTFIIFLVSGFWHGANWNFIAWGGIHACGFLPLLLTDKNRRHISSITAFDRKIPNVKELLQMIATFGFVTFAWIFFRNSLKAAVDCIRQIVVGTIKHPGQYLTKPPALAIFYYVIPLILLDWWLRRDEREIRLSSSRMLNWSIYIIVSVLVFDRLLASFEGQPTNFIYFQF